MQIRFVLVKVTEGGLGELTSSKILWLIAALVVKIFKFRLDVASGYASLYPHAKFRGETTPGNVLYSSRFSVILYRFISSNAIVWNVFRAELSGSSFQ